MQEHETEPDRSEGSVETEGIGWEKLVLQTLSVPPQELSTISLLELLHVLIDKIKAQDAILQTKDQEVRAIRERLLQDVSEQLLFIERRNFTTLTSKSR